MLIAKNQSDQYLNRLYDEKIIAALIGGVVKILRSASNPTFVAFYTYKCPSDANFADKHPAGAIKAVQDSGYKVRTFKNLEELDTFTGTGKKPASKINVENHTEAYLARLATKYFIGYKTGGGTVAQLQYRKGAWGFAYILKDGSVNPDFPSQLVFASDSAGKSIQQAAADKTRTLYRFNTCKAFDDFFFEEGEASETPEPCPIKFEVNMMPRRMGKTDFSFYQMGAAELKKRMQQSTLRGRQADCIILDDVNEDQPQEEDTMNLNKVEFKEVLNGQDLGDYTDTDILSMIQKCEDNIDSLNNIKTPSKRIDEMKTEQEATINKLVELLDNRAATENT